MKITYSTTTKLRLLSQFQNVNESLKVFADYHNVGAGSLKRWIQQYLTGGLANLERPVHNRRYPKKLKLRAVRDYRNHRLPTKEILLKYDIRPKKDRQGAKQTYQDENLLNRQFKQEKPNQVWVTDTTELTYGTANKVRLHAILDLYGQRPAAWLISRLCPYNWCKF